MLHELKLENLTHLDGGRIVEALQQALKRAALDCEDRPGESKTRVVNLQFEFAPRIDSDGVFDTVDMKAQVKETFPTRKSRKYNLGYRKGGMLTFNDLSDENFHQKSIDEE
jgi:hypothetical protein